MSMDKIDFDLNFFRFALNHIQEAVYLVDQKANIHYVNQRACSMLGYSEEELLSLSVFDIDRDFSLEIWQAQWDAIIGQQSRNLERKHIDKSGGVIPVEINANYFVYGKQPYILTFARNISMRKQIDQMLKINNDRYAMAQSIGHVGNWEYDLQTTEFWGSDEAKRIYGFDINQDNFTTEEVESCIPERELVHQALMDLIEKNKPYDLEIEIHPKNGDPAKIITSVAVLMNDEEGNPTRVVGVIQDISARRKNEEKISQLADIVHYSGDAIIGETLDGIITSWNQGAEKLYGYTEDEILGKSISLLVPERDQSELAMHLEEINIGNKIENHEVKRLRKDGKEIYVSISISPIFNSSGKVIAASSIARDISEKKRTAAIDAARINLIEYSMNHTVYELMEETINQAEFLTGSKIGFFHYIHEDQETITIQNWSTKTKAVFCKAEGMGSHYDIDEAGVWVDCVHKRKPVIHNDYESLPHRKGLPEGHAMVKRELVVPVFRGNKIVAILGVGNKDTDYDKGDVDFVSRIADLAWEINERKRVEEQIQQLNIELENRVVDRTLALKSANEELEAFAYSVSHDLRAPLRHINGYLTLLRESIDEHLTEDSTYYLNTISKASTKMNRLIEDLLAFSRMGRFSMSKSVINLNSLFKEIISEFKEDVQDRNITWNLDDLPAVYGDYSMIYLAFVNLISNALKYSKECEHTIIDIKFEINEKGGYTISIHDNGIGFDMNYANKLFGVFERLHKEDEYEGTGIGLATVKRIIKRHEGEVWAEGKVGNGATFYVSLPKPEK
jgi:PAS domain S-box-containing protein